jgi:hypothetical protein
MRNNYRISKKVIRNINWHLPLQNKIGKVKAKQPNEMGRACGAYGGG